MTLVTDYWRRIGALVLPVLLAGIAGVIYLRTLAPTITWRNTGADSGDLIAAAFTGGIPHPPGYPLYTLLAQWMMFLPMGGIAYRVNLLSALAAVGAIVLLYDATRRLIGNDFSSALMAAVTTLAFAFSPLFWSQATIAEVYALHLFFVAALLNGWLRWKRAARLVSRRDRLWVSVALGCGIAHHPTIVLLLPLGMMLLWRRDGLRELLGILATAFLLGLALDLTLLWRAQADPPVSWGDPTTLERWWWLISGKIYRGYLFGVPLLDYPARLSVALNLLFDQFNVIGVVLGIWGALEQFVRSRRHAIALLTTFMLYALFAIGYQSVDSNVYLLPAFLIFSVWMAVGIKSLVDVLIARLPASRQTFSTALMVGLAFTALPLLNLARNFAAMDLSRDAQAIDYARVVFASVPNDAVIVADSDEHIFALVYFRYVEQPASQVQVVATGLLDHAWYRNQIRRQNPALMVSEHPYESWDRFIVRLIADNSPPRSVFATRAFKELQDDFYFRPHGRLFQLASQ